MSRQFSLGASLYSTVTAPKTADKLLHVCVVGSGPAGFYTASQLLKKYGDSVRVNIVDRLATPFGLVRSGVAPDHQDTKNVINQYSELIQDPRCSFFGHVNVGTDVSVDELRKLHNAVVLAYGAESDRKLNVPGEDLKGVFSAREFVWWYNGHPDGKTLPVDLSKVTSVAICGIGNVALDCARILLQPVEELEPTDIAGHALKQLRKTFTHVQSVHVVARRGPVQAAFTAKEMKELVTEPGVAFHVEKDQLAVSPEDQQTMKSTRLKRRIFELIEEGARTAAGKQLAGPQVRHLHFQFYRKPVAVLGDALGRVEGLKVEKTKLKFDADGNSTAVGTGEFEVLPVQMVLKSIGYKGVEMPGVPFDASTGTVPNSHGRVLSMVNYSGFARGLYVVGWLKRGPTGIIGTNLVDAEDTVQSIIRDTPDLPSIKEPKYGAEGLEQLLSQKGVLWVDVTGWKAIDAMEVANGMKSGKLREKLTDVTQMLAVSGASQERRRCRVVGL